MAVKYDVLGPLCVRGAGEVKVTRPALRRLLSILLLDAGAELSCDVLIERVWNGDPPSTAKNSLQAHISGLRRLLGAGAIETARHGYRLRSSPGCLDAEVFVDRFSDVVRQVDRAEWAVAIRSSDSALELWRGRPYEDIADESFAVPEVSRLEEVHQQLMELRVRAMLAAGRNEEALPDIERLVGQQPYREHLWALLMVGRYRLGLQRGALQAFEDAAHRLDEVGLVPGPALGELTARIAKREKALSSGPLPLW